MHDELAAGAYESLHTHGLQRALSAFPPEQQKFAHLDAAEAPQVLARHIADAVRRSLEDVSHDQRQQRINELLALVVDDQDAVVALEQLLALAVPDAPGVHRIRSATPLSDVALLTNTRGEPSLGAELRAELASADEVDLLCAFIRWHGIRVLADELDALRARGVPLRVITTTYRGATERRALDELVNRFGAEVRVRYDAESTRLHAKAWLFRRGSGFDTGQVLADGTFGELYVGGQRPQRWEHVFASVQSLQSLPDLPRFDVVVIDEFHHAEAPTYRKLVGIEAGELLGLTATPERADGVDVRSFFDGRTAFELPLGDALEQDLLPVPLLRHRRRHRGRDAVAGAVGAHPQHERGAAVRP